MRRVNRRPWCLRCGALAQLEFAPFADASAGARATRNSPVRLVLMHWSPARGRVPKEVLAFCAGHSYSGREVTGCSVPGG